MRKWIVGIGGGAVVLTLLAALMLWLLLRSSLPMLEGQTPLPGLTAEATLERDALGTVTVSAADEFDAARSLGFVHAQERFFEMDLARRSAAGELAELVGPAALPRDRANRVHRLRARAPAHLASLTAAERALLTAYTQGVNAGLKQLQARPPAYLLLGSAPRPWREEDSLLVGLSMFFELQDSQNRRELALMQIRRRLPKALADALSAPGTAWDAPLLGEPWPELDSEPLLAALQSIPMPVVADAALSAGQLEPHLPGSNNFAVAGALTADGRALVADDMHLGLRAPGTWFRARLQYADARAPEGRIDATGVSLPGLPGLVVGSTGHIAWGFTNSYGDWLDWVEVEWADAEKSRYRSGDGTLTLQTHVEKIHVRGGDSEPLHVRETRWGPLLAETPEGHSLALQWTAHRPGAVNLGLLRLLYARNVDEAVAIARSSGTPAQNFVVGDSGGRIAWTLMGRLPERLGDCDPAAALRPALGCDWAPDWLPADRVPDVIDPADARLWTANSRVVDAESLRLVGDGGYDFGARQRQIRDALRAGTRFSEADLLALQLDDRALFLLPWWERLRATLVEHAEGPALAELERATREPPLHAAIDSVSYRAARGYRGLLLERVFNAVLAPVQAAEGEAFVPPRTQQFEPVLLAILKAQPAALLPQGTDSYAALQHQVAKTLAAELSQQGQDLSQRNWGERNTARICHPMASALPAMAASWLCMPAQPLPGDSNLPRVQGPSFGASQRMVVAPGHEADGIFHMPGGQSGHPLSPFWGSGHTDWAQGESVPFLPGPARHRLRLSP